MAFLQQQPARPDGWTMIQGVTADDSLDPLGQQVSALHDPSKGTHYSGLSQPGGRPSNLIYRLYFDPVIPVKYNVVGYLQFIDIEFNGTSVDPSILPGLAARASYRQDGRPMLDFMNPIDAQMRFVTPGFISVATPFYAFNAFLALYADVAAVGLHPMPYGSVVHPGTIPAAPSITWNTERSRVASLRTLITPLQLTEGALLPYCAAGGEFFDEALADDGSSLLAGIVKAYNQEYDQEASAADAQGIGALLVVTLDDGEVIAGKSTPVTAPGGQTMLRLQVWLIGQEDFDHLEHEAALEVADRLGAWLEKTSPSASLAGKVPAGRGRGGLHPPHPVVWLYPDRPLLTFSVYSVLTEMQRNKPVPHSVVKATFLWYFDTMTERFTFEAGVQTVVPISAEQIIPAVELYKQLIVQQAPAGTPDISVFSLARSGWIDDAPQRVPHARTNP